MKERKNKIISSVAVTVAFLLMLVFPAFNQLMNIVERNETDQPTEEIKAPVFDVSHLDRFPEQFDKYFLNRLTIRDGLVLVNSMLKIYVFKVSPRSSEVIIGSDGWMFQAGETLNAYTNQTLFSDEQLDSMRTILKKRYDFANERGIKFYIAIVPNKAEIHYEHLPSNVARYGDISMTDQLLEYLKNDKELKILDLRKDLLEHKQPTPLYYYTDNHWNFIGAYYGYCRIMKEISDDFPSVGNVLSLDSFRIDSSTREAGGETRLINMQNYISENRVKVFPKYSVKAKDGVKMNYESPKGFPYSWDYEVVKEVSDSTLPKALFIRDSFLDYMIIYLQEHFSKSVYIFDNWEYGANTAIIESEKPDLIVLCINDNAYLKMMRKAYKAGNK